MNTVLAGGLWQWAAKRGGVLGLGLPLYTLSEDNGVVTFEG